MEISFGAPRMARLMAAIGASLGVFALLGNALARDASEDAAGYQAQCLADKAAIKVMVTNIKHGEGLIVADLHGDDPRHFLKKGKKLERIRVPVTGEAMTVCIIPPGPGTYAVALYHDENANRKFDKNFLGIPVEPFGISNNPTIFFGPPALDAAAFEVTAEGARIEVELKD